MKRFLATAFAIAAAIPGVASAQQSGAPFGATAVDAEALHAIVGQADLQSVTSNNNATVTNNQVNGTSVTGTISLDGQTLQGANGLVVLSANTGNNVAINAAMNVNVSITQ